MAIQDLSKYEQLVDTYLAENQTEKAVELLFKLVVRYAKDKQFHKAEELKDKLFAVDSSALYEIIRANEIIEEEKSGAIDKLHMEVWQGLYKNFTSTEAQALYFAMKDQQCNGDTPLFQQGEACDKLYFIDKGQLKLIYHHDDTEELITLLEPGCIAGEQTFFSISLCTTSLLTMSRVQLKYLLREDFLTLQEQYHGLGSKLEEYCSKITKTNESLKEKGLNRRQYKRLKIDGVVSFQILNPAGRPISKTFKGDLANISEGGMAFYIKTSNQQTVLTLLGRRLMVDFKLPQATSTLDISQTGIITAVVDHLFGDYIVHVKFDQPLETSIMTEVEFKLTSQQQQSAATIMRQQHPRR